MRAQLIIDDQLRLPGGGSSFIPARNRTHQRHGVEINFVARDQRAFEFHRAHATTRHDFVTDRRVELPFVYKTALHRDRVDLRPDPIWIIRKQLRQILHKG